MSNEEKKASKMPENTGSPQGSLPSQDGRARTGAADPNSEKQEKKRFQRRRQWQNLRFSALSLLVVGVFFVLMLGYLIVFPRSTASEIEYRSLTAFPESTLADYFSGDYTSGIATWFDDTVPNRDTLKNLSYRFTSLFGFTSSTNTITYINQDVVANDMNAATADAAADAEEETPEPETSPAGEETLSAAEESSAEEPEEEEEEEEEEQTDYTAQDAEFDLTNGLLVVYQNNHWKCLSLFGGGSGSGYVSALNSLQDAVGDSVNIYSMPAPLSSQYYVPSNASSYSVDQEECLDSVAEQLDDEIVTVDLCPILAKHTDEDIYLRTDHHWAPLGAYYAARAFAEAAGVPFADLSEYTEGVNEGYVGTMYAYSKDSRILNDPEDFVYYVPSNEYTTYYYDTYFNYSYQGSLIVETDTANSYLMFMGGDEKIVKIKTDVGNGRKLLVIKDSYGNAEIPFYTGSFEEVYVIDMRYFYCNLINFIEDLGITDVLFTMCSYSVVGTNADNLATLMAQNSDVRVVDQEPAITAEKEAEAAAEAAAAAEETGTYE